MAKPLRCDQCGRDLTEEDFEAGRAVRDRADVFCAECASMYEDDDRKRRMRERMAEAAAAIPKARRGATTAMRARTPGRRFSARGSQAVRGRPAPSNLMTFYAIAAAIAVLSIAIIMAVLMSRGRKSRERPTGPRRSTPAVGTGSTTTGKTPPDKTADDGTTTRPDTGTPPKKAPDDDGPPGKSLLGPGGELDGRPK